MSGAFIGEIVNSYRLRQLAVWRCDIWVRGVGGGLCPSASGELDLINEYRDSPPIVQYHGYIAPAALISAFVLTSSDGDTPFREAATF